jgi:hypothetical protein
MEVYDVKRDGWELGDVAGLSVLLWLRDIKILCPAHLLHRKPHKYVILLSDVNLNKNHSCSVADIRKHASML